MTSVWLVECKSQLRPGDAWSLAQNTALTKEQAQRELSWLLDGPTAYDFRISEYRRVEAQNDAKS